MVATAVSLSLVDRVGRKKCLLIGIFIMGLAILTLGIFALVNGSEASKQTCHQFINKTLVVGNDSTTHRPLDVAKYVTYDLNHAHFMYVKVSEKATKFCEIFILLLSVCTVQGRRKV